MGSSQISHLKNLLNHYGHEVNRCGKQLRNNIEKIALRKAKGTYRRDVVLQTER